jgi:hypothetical protein
MKSMVKLNAHTLAITLTRGDIAEKIMNYKHIMQLEGLFNVKYFNLISTAICLHFHKISLYFAFDSSA